MYVYTEPTAAEVRRTDLGRAPAKGSGVTAEAALVPVGATDDVSAGAIAQVEAG